MAHGLNNSIGYFHDFSSEINFKIGEEKLLFLRFFISLIKDILSNKENPHFTNSPGPKFYNMNYNNTRMEKSLIRVTFMKFYQLLYLMINLVCSLKRPLVPLTLIGLSPSVMGFC